jgi:CRISPR-associated protein Cmr3
MGMYFIEAYDTLFFRDGRPFEFGGYANLQVPPSPSSFYGAIRSALITSKSRGFEMFKTGRDATLKAVVGEIGDSEGTTAKLQINGPVFARLSADGVTGYFPLPRDLLVHTHGMEKTNKPRRGYLVQTIVKKLPEGIETNCAQNTFLMNPFAQSMAQEDILLSNVVFAKYLSGDLSFPYEIDEDQNALRSNQLFLSDFREGIALKSNQKNVETSKLFTMQHLTFDNDPERPFGFVLEIHNNTIELGESTHLRLGGDGKVAQLRAVDANWWEIERIKERIDANKMFKIYLATPAIFEFGWKSKAMHNNYCDDHPGLEFELITAAIGRAVMYGGYDMVANVPKVSFPAVPAGSVYYFKLNKGTADDVVKAFHQRCISDFRSNQGFGYSFVGGITNV